MPEVISSTRSRRMKCKFRSIGSRYILLLLLNSFSITVSYFLNIIIILHNYHGHSGLSGAFMGLAIIISQLIASFLPEVVISRYKLTSYSLKALWLVLVANCILVTTNYMFNVGLMYSIQLVVLGLVSLPTAACLVSVVQLGTDQIITGSHSNISSFIHWLVWSIASGVTVAHVLTITIDGHVTLKAEADVIISLVSVFLLSLSVILDFLLGHRLVQEPVTSNPLTLIYKVLKYAVKHKYPVRRSAFTYCENILPSRLDFGKSKYGGPFTTEQVEDVKTFWRIILVLLVTSLLAFPVRANWKTSINLYSLTAQLNFIEGYTEHMFGVVIVCIPLYELLVYPLLRERGPRILQSVGIGAAATVLSSLFGLTAETVQYFVNNTQCWLADNLNCSLSLIPCNLTLTFAAVIVIKSSLEFVCAQAPYNMKGLLYGVYITSFVMMGGAGVLVHLIWRKEVDNSRYGILYYLTTLILAVISSVLLGCVIRWYKIRERDEITGSQAMVEEIYYKYQQQEDGEQK